MTLVIGDATSLFGNVLAILGTVEEAHELV